MLASILASSVIIIPGITLGVVSTKYKEHNSKISPFNTMYNNEQYVDLYKYTKDINFVRIFKLELNELSKKFGHYLSLDWLIL